MYESYFQLTKAPFSLVSDPGCIHVTRMFANVIQNLVHGVLERRGCLALTGEPGLGKTTILNALCDFLIESNAQASTISIPTITAPEFLELLMLNFGFQDIPASKARRLKALEEFLLRSDNADRVSALIVDEAHRLSDEILEEIRLLSNFETGNRKLLQIVLAGQNELNVRLNRPELSQFKQRIATRLTLHRLDRDGVADYVNFRWSEAATSPSPFSGPALEAIAAWSGGIPRTINVICHNALLIAFAATNRNLDAATIRAACIKLDLPAPKRGYSIAVTETELPSMQELIAIADDSVNPLAVEPDGPSSEAPKNSLLNRWRRGGSRSTESIRPRSFLSLEDPS